MRKLKGHLWGRFIVQWLWRIKQVGRTWVWVSSLKNSWCQLVNALKFCVSLRQF